MSLEPDGWAENARPRHKLRAYGSVVTNSTVNEYRRLLNFLSESVVQDERNLTAASATPKSIPPDLLKVAASIASASAPPAPAAASLAAVAAGNVLALVASETVSIPPQASSLALNDPQNVMLSLVQTTNSTTTGATAASGSTGGQTIDFSPPNINIPTLPTLDDEDDDGKFLSHLSSLLNQWFDQENADTFDEDWLDSDDLTVSIYDGKAPASKPEPDKHAEARRLLSKFGGTLKASSNAGSETASQPEQTPVSEQQAPVSEPVKSSATPPAVPRMARSSEVNRKHWLNPDTVPLKNGNRKEVFQNGSVILKDAVGRVREVTSEDGVTIMFSYDQKGHLQDFIRTDATGKVHSTGEKDRHGVVVRDASGRVKAQGDSMSVDPHGCVSIRKFDGQFWSLDAVRGIHVERRILEDSNGAWNSLTALLTCDGFRMVTRFQKLKAENRESYRKYGDWLGSEEASKFRFYGRDGSMIQFESDEDLKSLRPARIWPPGSLAIEGEWRARRQAGTAWDAVHQYVSQYLSAL